MTIIDTESGWRVHCLAGHLLLPPGDHETAARAVQHAVCTLCHPVPDPHAARLRTWHRRLALCRPEQTAARDRYRQLIEENTRV